MYIFRIQSHLVFFRLLILTFFSTYFMFCNLFKLNRGLNMFLIRAVFSLSHHPSFFYRFLLIQICLSTGGLACRHKSHLFSKLAYSQGSLRAPCHRVSRLLSRMSSGHSHSFVDGKTWLLQMPDAPISYRWKVTTEQKRHRLSPWEHHPKIAHGSAEALTFKRTTRAQPCSVQRAPGAHRMLGVREIPRWLVAHIASNSFATHFSSAKNILW